MNHLARPCYVADRRNSFRRRCNGTGCLCLHQPQKWSKCAPHRMSGNLYLEGISHIPLPSEDRAFGWRPVIYQYPSRWHNRGRCPINRAMLCARSQKSRSHPSRFLCHSRPIVSDSLGATTLDLGPISPNAAVQRSFFIRHKGQLSFDGSISKTHIRRTIDINVTRGINFGVVEVFATVTFGPDGQVESKPARRHKPRNICHSGFVFEGRGRYSGARMAQRWSRARVIWEMSDKGMVGSQHSHGSRTNPSGVGRVWGARQPTGSIRHRELQRSGMLAGGVRC